jgi:hypothetical protein
MSVRRTATVSYETRHGRPRLHNHKTRLLFSTTTNIRLPRLPEATTPFTPHSPYRAKPSLLTSPTHLVRDPPFVALRIPYIPKLSLQYINRTPANSQKIDKTSENPSYKIPAL